MPQGNQKLQEDMNVTPVLNKSVSESDITGAPGDQKRTAFKRRCLEMTAKSPSEELIEFKEEIRELFQASENRQDELRKSLETQGEQMKMFFSGIQDSFKSLSVQITDFRTKIETMETELKKKDERILTLEKKLEYTEKEIRKTCLEIRNVPLDPSTKTEDLLVIMDQLAKSLDINMERSCIRDIYKIIERKTIIVDLNSVILKNNILKQCKQKTRNGTKLCVKHLGIQKDPDTSVYVSPRLTSKAARLYYLARQVKSTKSYKSCYTTNGRVYLQKSEDSQIIEVKDESIIQELLKEN